MKRLATVELTGSALPARVLDLPEPPSVLYVRGELPRGAAVAIVGTRYPTPAGRRYARQLAAELARAGVAILSGGAKGIDAAAHRGALAAGGTTVVVAPSGWRRPSPEEHRELFRVAVRKGGAYVSLVPEDVPSARAQYFPRNAVLVALAHVVVVVEAPFKSGARNAAAAARRLGRPLFVCAAPPWQATGLGCLLELRYGARPLLSPRDILKELSEQRVHPVAMASRERRRAAPARQPGLFESAITSVANDETIAKSKPCAVGEARERLLAALEKGPLHLDEACRETALPPAELHELLLTLRLDGVLVCDATGRVSVLK